MLKLRLLKDDENDYKLLYKWYHNPKVNTYFEQRIPSYKEIVTKYSKRTSLDSLTPVYMIEYNSIPVGIIQYTKLTKETKELYNINNDGYDIDIFIGENNYYHKGIGTNAIKLLIKKLKKDNIIFTMVPEIINKEAIDCYEKIGFKKEYIIKDHDTLGNKKEKIVMTYR